MWTTRLWTRTAAVLVAILAAGAIPSEAEGAHPLTPIPRAASPGSETEVPLIASSCPTFSWSAVPGARAHEAVVVELDGSAADREEPALAWRSPGAAGAWTPDASRCLTTGVRYAWSVRALFEGDRVGDWSPVLTFEIAGAEPSAGAISAAPAPGLGRSPLSTDSGPVREPGPAPRSRSADHASRAESRGAGTGTFAIRGENPSTSPGSAGVLGSSTGLDGSVSGVLGLAESSSGSGVTGEATSPTGVGVRAGNLDPGGGPDLVLDGSAQSAADAVLTEAGIDRSSPGAETFDIGNSGTGSLTLTVDGVEVGDVTAVTAGDGLSGGGDVGELGLEIAAGGVVQEMLAADAVTSSKIADGTITAADLATDSVGSSEIAAGAVKAVEVDRNEVQLRVDNTCPGGSSIRSIDAIGRVICETDTDTDTTYSAGVGLTLVGTTFSAAGSHFENVVVVAKSGGDFTTIQSALDSITDAADDNPYLVWVAPGVYEEQVTMKPWVTLEGAGPEATIVRWLGGAGSPGSADPSSATLVATGDCVVRRIAVESDGTGEDFSVGVYTTGGGDSLLIEDARVTAGGADLYSAGIYNRSDVASFRSLEASSTGGQGILSDGGTATLEDVHVEGSTDAIRLLSSATMFIRDSVAVAGTGAAVFLSVSDLEIAHSRAVGGLAVGAGSTLACFGVYDENLADACP